MLRALNAAATDVLKNSSSSARGGSRRWNGFEEQVLEVRLVYHNAIYSCVISLGSFDIVRTKLTFCAFRYLFTYVHFC